MPVYGHVCVCMSTCMAMHMSIHVETLYSRLVYNESSLLISLFFSNVAFVVSDRRKQTGIAII